MNTIYNANNVAIVKALVKNKGIKNAERYIAETIRVQKINGNKNMISVWESNMFALKDIKK